MRTEPVALADAFRAFEHEGWERVPDAYGDAFGALTSHAAGPLLDAAGVRRGVRVLDVATGPGYVAAAAVERGARAAGIDFSRTMVEGARQRYPEVEFHEGDAEELPVADGSVDAVVMNFGLLHLARPERALAEAHRALRPGGRFAFTVWAGPDEAVGFGIVLRAVEAHGRLDVPLPPGPPFFRFSDSAESVRALRDAGFVEPGTSMIPLMWRLPTRSALFERMQGATVRTSGLLRAQDAEALARIRESVDADAARFLRGDAVELPMPAVVASATKP